MTAAKTTERGDALATYIAGARNRELPAEIVDAACRALADYLGCALGATDDGCTVAVRAAAASWNAQGRAQVFLHGRTTPALAALVNGTATHAMDFDDTHPMGTGHPSGPCWSTALALAQEHGIDEKTALKAFVAGFEVMARLGGGGPPGVGRSLQRRGFHPTSVFGRVAAAATASVMLGLDRQQVAYALGVAATTAGGLLGSFGTHSKPFHAGKAAMDGILAAQMAASGFISSTALFEERSGLLGTFIQDHVVEVPPLDFEARWELLRNGYKPYASCRATHASSQAARSLAARVGKRKVAKIDARVHPNALVTAGRPAPKTPLEGKFSVGFCIALGLRGYTLGAADFREETFADSAVMEILPTVTLHAVEGQAPHSAFLDVVMEDGEVLHAETQVVRGHPDNPMTRDELWNKFAGLVSPRLGGDRASTLFETALSFTAPGSLEKLGELLRKPD